MSGVTLPFIQDSDTSEAAAKAARPAAATARQRVRKCIQEAGRIGMTDLEVQAALEMDPSTQRPRRVELVNLGLVFDSGDRRLTPSRRKATVWVAKEFYSPGAQQPLGLVPKATDEDKG